MGFTLGLMKSPTTGSWPGLQYEVWVRSCGAGLESNQKVAGDLHNIHATIVQIGTPCQVAHYVPHRVQFSKGADDFSPPAAYIGLEEKSYYEKISIEKLLWKAPNKEEASNLTLCPMCMVFSAMVSYSHFQVDNKEQWQ